MKKTVILNLKMNLTYDEALKYVEAFREIKTDIVDVIVCPSSIYLEVFKKLNYTLGAQNVFYLDKGPYTGEISPLQLSTMGITYALVGHSERRHIFNESNDMINKKVIGCLKHNIKPVLCIGETLEERDAGKTDTILKSQIQECLKDLSLDQINNIIIAYEPVWAIGSYIVPSLNEIEDILNTIKNIITNDYETDIKVLYGGSVNESNIKDIINLNNIDGVLIGTASINIDEVINILNLID